MGYLYVIISKVGLLLGEYKGALGYCAGFRLRRKIQVSIFTSPLSLLSNFRAATLCQPNLLHGVVVSILSSFKE